MKSKNSNSRIRSLILIVLAFSLISVKVNSQTTGYPFKSFTEFRSALDQIAGMADPDARTGQLDILWEQLRADNQIPFRYSDSAAFLYRGEAKSVAWAGDFSQWKPGVLGFAGTRAGKSDLWVAVGKFPLDARLDYKVIVDDQWILDPANPTQQMGGAGPNSVLHMPDWKFPDETELAPDVIRGELSDNILIKSEKLGYSVNYRVYTPYNYALSEGLPVIYVTDGPDYSDDEKGAMVIVMDNLIYSGDMKPVVAVFIDPWEPGNDRNNRRMQEYDCNQKFADFVGDELVPLIDKVYKTHACPDDRAILGTSMGGICAAWFGAVRINDFHLLGINSPAFNKQVLDRFAGLDWFPFRVYMTTGVIYDTQKQALEMKAILEKNQVGFEYREVNEGHSWGNWKALLPDMLRYFFPTQL